MKRLTEPAALGLRQFEDFFVHRGERAGRIGVAGIAGQGKGLAATTAEINFLEFAAAARLRHPAGAAVAVEGFGVLPDPGDRMIGAHRFEFEPGDALGGVAGQDLAGRRDIEELPAPAAHAISSAAAHNNPAPHIDRQNAFQPRLGFFDDPAGFLDLLQGRHQRGAVLQRPAVILHIGDLEPVGIEIDRHLDDVGELMQVLPVHHRINGERQIELAGPFRDFELFLVGLLESGDAVGQHRFVALEADLHMAQPGIGQRAEPFPGQEHGGGDQIGIQPTSLACCTSSTGPCARSARRRKNESAARRSRRARSNTFFHSSV